MSTSRRSLIVTFLQLAAIAAGQSEVYVAPFSHLDLYWAGTREECLSRGNRIISKALSLAAKQSEFRFLIEDNVFAANYVDTHLGQPELDQLKALVKQGRFEIAPKWAGILQNLPRGEAHVRNQLIGKRYAKEVFGVDPQVAHLGDLPGYTLQFPQILAKSRTPYMAMTRMGPPDRSMFRWRAPDGSNALVWNAIKGYGWGVGLGLHRDLDEARIAAVAKSVAEVQKTTPGPIFLGWGTDLWSPSEKLAANVSLLDSRLAPSRYRLSTPQEFFAAASRTASIPEIAGEIPSSWANIISSMSHLWPPVMPATDTLLTAEKFAAVNYALGYASYPEKEFDSLWRTLLEAMDHNNFGQGGESADRRKIAYAQMVQEGAGQIGRDMLRNIAERVRLPVARSAAIVVFNPLNWKRDDEVRAHVSLYGDVSPGDIEDYRKALILVDETGQKAPFHIMSYSGTVSRALELVFIARDVPPLGYRTYFIVPSENLPDTTPSVSMKPDVADPLKPKRVFGSDEFETGDYRVSIDRATGGVTVFDKELGRVVVNGAGISAAEQRGGDTLSIERPSGRTLIHTITRVATEENNAVRTVIRIEGQIAGVPVTQRLTLFGGLKKIEFENTVDWSQDRFLKIEQVFPYEDAGAGTRYGVPFGSAGDNDVFPNSGPHFSDEVPREIWKQWRQIQDWIWVGQPAGGFTVSADRQLVTLDNAAVRVGMMRGAYSPVGIVRDGKPYLHQFPPTGRYVFRYSLTSGKGDWAAAKSYRAGMGFSNPLLPVAVADEISSKSLPPKLSFLEQTAENAVLTTLKKSGTDGSLVLRVVEMEGKAVEGAVRWMGEPRRLQPVNLLEENVGAGAVERLGLAPYEISTVRVVLGSRATERAAK